MSKKWYVLSFVLSMVVIIIFLTINLLTKVEYIIHFVYLAGILYSLYIKINHVKNYETHKRSIYTLSFELLNSLMFLIPVVFILEAFNIGSINSFSFIDFIVLLLVGYSDTIIKYLSKNLIYPDDHIIMYILILLFYILIECGVFSLQYTPVYRNTLAFVLFIELIIPRLTNGIQLKNTVNLKLNVSTSYLPLTAKKNIIQSPYFEMLHYGINQRDITNIAITSVFGGGKSSIIESYLRTKKKSEIIRISLSNFTGMNKDRNVKISGNEKGEDFTDKIANSITNELQLKIIKHLYYKVNHDRLPKSKYTRKDLTIKSFFTILVFTTLLYGMFVLINTTFLGDKYPITIYTHLLPIIAATLLFMILNIAPININKFISNIGTFELDKFNTPFDKYLEEIVYFFHKTSYKIVLIEDLDRFQSIEIFNSLREINLLLNQCEGIKHKITFIYAINDQLLEEENLNHAKGKFFDLVIPVIPISTSYNSSGYIRQFFNEVGCKLSIDESNHDLPIRPSDQIIDDISFYISDMRTMKTIVNEYIVSLKSLIQNRGSELISKDNQIFFDKFFAMIVYKNYMPKDYNDLFYNRGVVYSILNNREKYIENKIIDLKQKIERIDKQMQYLSNFGVDKTIYASVIKQIIRNKLAPHYSAKAIIFNSNNQQLNIYNVDSIYNMTEKDFLDTFIQFTNVPTEPNKVLLSDWIDKQMNDEMMYHFTIQKHQKLITDREFLNKKLKTIKYCPFNEIIKTVSQDDIISSVCENNEKRCILPIIIFLLKRGYISEDYSIYMNYFVNGKRSYNDEMYIQAYNSITDFDPQIELLDKEGIIHILETNYREDNAIVNFSLMDYLINNKKFDMFEWFIDKTAQDLTDSTLVDYILIERHNNTHLQIMKYIISYKSLLLNKILRHVNESQDGEYHADILCNYILLSNNSINLSDLLDDYSHELLNHFKRIGLYHGEISDKSVVDKFNDNLIYSKIKLSEIEQFSDNNNLLDHIAKHNLYEINPQMIKTVYNHITNNDEFPSLTNILTAQDNDVMKDYISNNIMTFIGNVMLSSGYRLKENSTIMTDILMNSTIDFKTKNNIIESDLIEFTIDNIQNIDDKLLSHLINNKRITYTTTNFDYIYKKRITIQNYSGILDFLVNISANDAMKYRNQITIIVNEYIRSDMYNYSHVKPFKNFIDLQSFKNMNNDKLKELVDNEIMDIESLNPIFDSSQIISLLEYMYLGIEGRSEQSFHDYADKVLSEIEIKNYLHQNTSFNNIGLFIMFNNLFSSSEKENIINKLSTELYLIYTNKVAKSIKKDDINLKILDLAKEFGMISYYEKRLTYMIYPIRKKV